MRLRFRRLCPVSVALCTGLLPLHAEAAAPCPDAAEPAAAEEPAVPTAEDLATLPAEEWARQQTAIKRVLLLRHARTLTTGYRITPEIEEASAGSAREWECPPLLADLFQELAGDEAGAARRYMLETALEAFPAAYGIDEEAILLLVRSARLSEEETEALADTLPLEALFNKVKNTVRDTPQLAKDIRVQASILQRAAAVLATVQDAESAAAALPLLAPLMQEGDSVLTARRMLINKTMPNTVLTEEALKQLQEQEQPFREQIQRLQEADWHGCPLLRVTPMLMN